MNFKYKYLKYKTKYTNLYNDLFGGSVYNNIDLAKKLADDNFDNQSESGSESESESESKSDSESGSEQTFESMCVNNVKGDTIKINIDFQRSLSSDDLSDDGSFNSYRSKKNQSIKSDISSDPNWFKWNNRQDDKQKHLIDDNSKKPLRINTNRNNENYSRKYYPIELNSKKC